MEENLIVHFLQMRAACLGCRTKSPLTVQNVVIFFLSSELFISNITNRVINWYDFLFCFGIEKFSFSIWEIKVLNRLFYTSIIEEKENLCLSIKVLIFVFFFSKCNLFLRFVVLLTEKKMIAHLYFLLHHRHVIPYAGSDLWFSENITTSYSFKWTQITYK